VRPAAAGDATRAHHLARDRITREADADDESFGILVFAGVRLAVFRRVQEETSTPRPRLACIHLRNSFIFSIDTKKKSNSTALRIKKKNRKD
jgi:hypothetical protein